MNKNELNTNLEEFCRKYLSPSTDERERVSKRFKELENILPGNEIFQSGSFGRETAVSPVHDLDVIWVLPESEYLLGSELSSKENSSVINFDVKKPLESLARMLEFEYKKLKIDVIIDHSQTHSVNISFKDREKFSIDVVPAIKSGVTNASNDDVYLVPEIQKMGHKRRLETYKMSENELEWILSDPKGYRKQSLTLNVNPSYRKAVKFAKVWKKSCNASLNGFELKSFHIELLIAEIFINNRDINFYDSITLFLENIGSKIEKPLIRDLADNNVFVDAYVSDGVEDSQKKIVVDYSRWTLNKFKEMFLKNNPEDLLVTIRESILSLPSWKFAPNHINIHITCQIERRNENKVLNSTNPKKYRNNLPGYFIKATNSPKDLVSGESIGKEFFLTFTPNIKGLEYDEIRWLVVNNGIPALTKGRIGGWRGNEFHNCTNGSTYREEHTEYAGTHWVDCYVLRNHMCIASSRFYVCINDN